MAAFEIIFENIHIYMYVFARLAAILLFSPVFSRTNIPAAVRTALVLFSTIIIAPIVPAGSQDTAFIDVMLGLGREFLVGFSLTFVFNIYYYMLMFAADVMDTQFGMSMAKVMDPQTRIQTAVTGGLVNVVFMLYFFATNSHLELIGTAAGSFLVIPPGAASISLKHAAEYAFTIFSSVFLLAIRLALPFVAAEFVLEVCMGILMKLIPQIHVFVIHMQGKILLGILLLLVLAAPITSFIDNYIADWVTTMRNMLFALGGK